MVHLGPLRMVYLSSRVQVCAQVRTQPTNASAQSGYRKGGCCTRSPASHDDVARSDGVLTSPAFTTWTATAAVTNPAGSAHGYGPRPTSVVGSRVGAQTLRESLRPN
jgi:hypothetical protein